MMVTVVDHIGDLKYGENQSKRTKQGTIAYVSGLLTYIHILYILYKRYAFGEREVASPANRLHWLSQISTGLHFAPYRY